jgi:hypothetical protein
MATFPTNPDANPLDGSEIIPITQGGVDKKTTAGALVDLAREFSYAAGGLASERPVDPQTEPGAIGLWWSTDTTELSLWDGSAWIEDVAAGGGGGVPPVVTESGTSLTADGTNSGKYTRFTNASAKTYSFDDSETYTIGAEYHGYNVGAGNLTLTEVGAFTVNSPAGGTLVIPQGGVFTVKIAATDEADLFGVTVAI